MPGKGIASTVSFDVEWRKPSKSQEVRKPTVGFEGTHGVFFS
jgi:hypothetical protein